MLITNSQLLSTPVVSLHIGGELARITACLINPDNLKLVAFVVAGPTITAETGDILDVKSIREFSPMGLIIDSIDSISKREDILLVKHIVKIDFMLLDLKVKTKKGTTVGTIIDFTVDNHGYMVKQLIVKRPALKSFLDPELTIDRNQIVEINDNAVIIKDSVDKLKQKTTATVPPADFVNPFRKPDFSPSDNQNLDAPDTE